MRYLVNGSEVELERTEGSQVDSLSDRFTVRSGQGTATALSVRVGDEVQVSFRGRTFKVQKADSGRAWSQAKSTGETRAPMPGQIVDVFVEQGTQVIAGQKLLVLEAMKMQHTVTAPFGGTVSALPVRKGDQVSEGELLVHVEATHE